MNDDVLLRKLLNEPSLKLEQVLELCRQHKGTKQITGEMKAKGERPTCANASLREDGADVVLSKRQPLRSSIYSKLPSRMSSVVLVFPSSNVEQSEEASGKVLGVHMSAGLCREYYSDHQLEKMEMLPKVSALSPSNSQVIRVTI